MDKQNQLLGPTWFALVEHSSGPSLLTKAWLFGHTCYQTLVAWAWLCATEKRTCELKNNKFYEKLTIMRHITEGKSSNATLQHSSNYYVSYIMKFRIVPDKQKKCSTTLFHQQKCLEFTCSQLAQYAALQKKEQ